MDGFKGRLTHSIRFRLSFGLSAAIVAIAIGAGALSFWSAYREAEDLQDDMLRQIAILFHDSPTLPWRMATADVGPPRSARTATAEGDDEEARVTVQDLAVPVPPAADPDAGPALPLPLPQTDGLHTIPLGGETFRVLVATGPSGRQIAVSQETGLRDEIAQASAERTIMPLLILVPILLAAVADITRKLFRPVGALAQELDRRPDQALHSIGMRSIPLEVRPFIDAINRLLRRVDLSMQTRRRFVQDAAHELRSPLTALSLQAERLAQVEMSPPARERLAALRAGIDRGRVLLDQLLSLARVQSAPLTPSSQVSVRAVYRDVLEDLMPLAEARGIDIGIEGADDATVHASQTDLTALVKNLVDNALRYTPAGGKVDLSVAVEGGEVVLRVADTGPGIPSEARLHVLEPFYRLANQDTIGSGLGLSIVKAVADRMGAGLSLETSNAATGTGLTVTVRVPLPAPRP
jgi:two-component system OmpR family sensor kinase